MGAAGAVTGAGGLSGTAATAAGGPGASSNATATSSGAAATTTAGGGAATAAAAPQQQQQQGALGVQAQPSLASLSGEAMEGGPMKRFGGAGGQQQQHRGGGGGVVSDSIRGWIDRELILAFCDLWAHRTPNPYTHNTAAATASRAAAAERERAALGGSQGAHGERPPAAAHDHGDDHHDHHDHDHRRRERGQPRAVEPPGAGLQAGAAGPRRLPGRALRRGRGAAAQGAWCGCSYMYWWRSTTARSPIHLQNEHTCPDPDNPNKQESAEAQAQAAYEQRRADEAAQARRAALEEAVQVRLY